MTTSDNKKDLEIDWVRLPANTQPQGLWDCLHDAGLLTIQSDLFNRTVILTFDAA